MPELRDRACLEQESLAQRGVGGDVRIDDFDRDRAVQRDVAREIDRAHAALTEQTLDGVLRANRSAQRAERVAWRTRGVGHCGYNLCARSRLLLREAVQGAQPP